MASTFAKPVEWQTATNMLRRENIAAPEVGRTNWAENDLLELPEELGAPSLDSQSKHIVEPLLEQNAVESLNNT